MRTLFFDIDGTLLQTKRAGSGALARAIRDEFGIDELCVDGVQFGGRTDRDLLREILTLAQIIPSPENQGRLRKRYSATLRRMLDGIEGQVLPGVTDLLTALSPLPDVSLAVMTGNFPETARMKLEAFRLIDYFPWIVGGDLDEVRCDMARRAAEQLVRTHGPESRSDMIVIGDTPNDVRCARSMGARCLAVCTGSATRDDLEAAAPDRLVEDLSERAALEFLVG
jgi:phosphoglycolate phosphatase